MVVKEGCPFDGESMGGIATLNVRIRCKQPRQLHVITPKCNFPGI